MFEDGF
jgi:hypothetical protein